MAADDVAADGLLQDLFSHIAETTGAPEAAAPGHEAEGMLEELYESLCPGPGENLSSDVIEQPLAVPVPQGELASFFGSPLVMSSLGNHIQQGLYQRFLKYCRKHEILPAPEIEPGEAHHHNSSTTAAVTSTVVSHFVQSRTMKSVAAVAESSGRPSKTVTCGLQRVASVLVHASAWMVGCALVTWRKLMRLGRFKPVAVIDKMLYDETPLKMKLQEWNNFLGRQEGMRHQAALQETYKYAKILRLDWQLGFLVWDVMGKRHRLVTVPLLVPLSCVDRNTAECLVGVIDQIQSLVPGLDAFLADFDLQIRMPVIDRFRANFKAERFFQTRTQGLVSSMFTCDVHKQSGCIKHSMSLSDDTFSGIINLALALEGSGSLDRLRQILQEIVADELIVVHAPPPGEDTHVFQHRKAVLDAFLPPNSVKNRKRRFIIHSLANSDISDHQIVHYCTFGCCSSPEQSIWNFQHWLVWALLPAKLGVFQRKSWTGSDTAVYWCALLHCHWGLLSKMILRFLSLHSVHRPMSSKSSRADDVGRADPAVSDMEALTLLFQDCLLSTAVD